MTWSATQALPVLRLFARSRSINGSVARRHHVRDPSAASLPVLTERPRISGSAPTNAFRPAEVQLTVTRVPRRRRPGQRVAIQADRHVIAWLYLPAVAANWRWPSHRAIQIEVHLVGMRFTEGFDFRGVHGLVIRFRPDRPVSSAFRRIFRLSTRAALSRMPPAGRGCRLPCVCKLARKAAI